MKDNAVNSKQKLRLIRLGMAFTTYLVVSIAALMVTRLGYGYMSATIWFLFISMGLIGNLIFFLIIRSNINLKLPDPSLTKEQIMFSTLWGLIPLYYLFEVRPIVLMFYIPAFSFGILRLNRKQYFQVVTSTVLLYAFVLLFEYTQNRQGFVVQYELFLFIIYSIILSWFAFFGGFVSKMRHRLSSQNKELQDALNEVKTLSGFLPICSSCKKIRDDKGYWNQIELYIRDHSNAKFSHSICPECEKTLYPELYNDEDDAEKEVN